MYSLKNCLLHNIIKRSSGLDFKNLANPLTFLHPSAIIQHVNRIRTSGFGVVATCNFPKVEITGSTPVTRSLKMAPARGATRFLLLFVLHVYLFLHPPHVASDCAQSQETD